MKQKLRPLFEWIIRQKIMYARGKSWFDFIGVAISAGAFSRYGIISLEAWSVVIILLSGLTLFAHFERRLGTWDYELDYTTQLNPYFRRLEERKEKKRKRLSA